MRAKPKGSGADSEELEFVESVAQARAEGSKSEAEREERCVKEAQEKYFGEVDVAPLDFELNVFEGDISFCLTDEF